MFSGLPRKTICEETGRTLEQDTGYKRYKCCNCGFEHNGPENFRLIDGKDICLDCNGEAPPTCGEHGDY